MKRATQFLTTVILGFVSTLSALDITADYTNPELIN